MKTFLKNHNLLVLLLLAVSLTSCSSDDDGQTPTVAELLKNKWYLHKIENTSTTPTTIVEVEDCQAQTYIQFLNDDSLMSKEFNGSEENCTSHTYLYTYSLNDEETEIYIQNEESLTKSTLNIEEISDTLLVLYIAADSPIYVTYKSSF